MHNIGFKELGILAKKYGFNNILDFSVWVEDNNLAGAMGIKGEEDDEEIEEDKDSRKYKSKVLALKILQLPEVQKALKEQGNIPIEKWEKWSIKIRSRSPAIKSRHIEDSKINPK